MKKGVGRLHVPGRWLFFSWLVTLLGLWALSREGMAAMGLILSQDA